MNWYGQVDDDVVLDVDVDVNVVVVVIVVAVDVDVVVDVVRRATNKIESNTSRRKFHPI